MLLLVVFKMTDIENDVLEDGDLKTFIESTKALTADKKAEELEKDQVCSTVLFSSRQIILLCW